MTILTIGFRGDAFLRPLFKRLIFKTQDGFSLNSDFTSASTFLKI